VPLVVNARAGRQGALNLGAPARSPASDHAVQGSEPMAGGCKIHNHRQTRERPAGPHARRAPCGEAQCLHSVVTKDSEKIGPKKVSAGFHSRYFYRATIAVTAFRALGIYPGKIATPMIEPRSAFS